MTTLLKDDKEIIELTLASGKKIKRFDGHIHRIEVYEEPGQGPWFTIHTFGGWIVARVNAAYVEEIQYKN